MDSSKQYGLKRSLFALHVDSKNFAVFISVREWLLTRENYLPYSIYSVGTLCMLHTFLYRLQWLGLFSAMCIVIQDNVYITE